MSPTVSKEIRDQVLSTKIKPSVKQKLLERAERKDKTLSEYVNEVLERHVRASR